MLAPTSFKVSSSLPGEGSCLTGPHWSHHPLPEDYIHPGLVGAGVQKYRPWVHCQTPCKGFPRFRASHGTTWDFFHNFIMVNLAFYSFLLPYSLQIFSLQANLQSESAVWGVPSGYIASLILGYWVSMLFQVAQLPSLNRLLTEHLLFWLSSDCNI